MLNSSWKIEKTHTANNISGRIGLKSPWAVSTVIFFQSCFFLSCSCLLTAVIFVLQGYRTGLFVTKFMFSQKRDVQGLTHLDLEEKVYTITVDGKFPFKLIFNKR